MLKTVSIKTKLALITSIILWASAFVGIRAGLQGYSPGGLALLRFLIASICMFFVYQRFAKRDVIPIKDKILLLLVGATGLGWYNITLNYGEISVQSGAASFIVSESPIITLLLAVLFLGEKWSVLSLFGMMISVLGVFLISVGQTHGFHFEMGMFYILLATIIGAFYSVLQKPFLKKYHAIDVTAYIIWGGTLMLFIFIPNLMHDVHTASMSATIATIYLGVFPATIAYLAWSYALVEIPASFAVSFLYFMPVIATLLGWLWLGEVPVLISFVGGLVALFGVWIVNHSYKRTA